MFYVTLSLTSLRCWSNSRKIFYRKRGRERTRTSYLYIHHICINYCVYALRPILNKIWAIYHMRRLKFSISSEHVSGTSVNISSDVLVLQLAESCDLFQIFRQLLGLEAELVLFSLHPHCKTRTELVHVPQSKLGFSLPLQFS